MGERLLGSFHCRCCTVDVHNPDGVIVLEGVDSHNYKVIAAIMHHGDTLTVGKMIKITVAVVIIWFLCS